MSRATRQEVLIRSLIEALCLTLKAKLLGQPRQKVKVVAVDQVLATIEALAYYCPLELEAREGEKVVEVLDWFHVAQANSPHLQEVETLVAMAMGLADKLVQVIRKGLKAGLVGELNRQLQSLYDTFDRQGKKLDLMVAGADFCDKILAREI